MLKPFQLVVESGPNNRLVIKHRPEKKYFNLAIKLTTKANNIQLTDTWISVFFHDKAKVKYAEGTELTLTELECGRYQVLVESIHHVTEEKVVDTSGNCQNQHLTVELSPNSVEHIEVSTNRYDISYAQSAHQLHMSREDIEQISHLANDVNRAVVMLPGMAGGGVSAELFIRGA